MNNFLKRPFQVPKETFDYHHIISQLFLNQTPFVKNFYLCTRFKC